jgi:hypothetical protein
VPLDCEGLRAGEMAVAVRLAAPDDAQDAMGY